jgi:hypothetical protein
VVSGSFVVTVAIVVRVGVSMNLNIGLMNKPLNIMAQVRPCAEITPFLSAQNAENPQNYLDLQIEYRRSLLLVLNIYLDSIFESIFKIN